MITDLTTGSAYKKLVRLSLPMMLSIVFQQLYNIVDSIIVGRFVGTNALAAVGASYSITMIFMAIATGTAIGITVVVSRFFGSKNYAKLKTAVWTAFISVSVLAIVLSAAGAFASRFMMKLLDTPAEFINDATQYLQIYFYGLIGVYIYNVCTGAFNGLGDANTTLYFLIFSSVANVGLDLLFVCALDMGVAGAAWATFISQMLAAALSVVVMLKRLRSLPCSVTPKRFSTAMLKEISLIAVPSIVQHSFVSVGNLFVQRRVNYFGADVAAAYAAAIKVNTFAIQCFLSMSNAMSSYSAQNLAAGRVDRVKKGFFAGNLIHLIICLPFAIAFFFFGDRLVGMFADSSTSDNIKEVIEVGSTFLKVVSPFYLIIGIKLIADGINRGAARMVAFMSSTFTDLVLRVVFAFVLSAGALGLEQTGIWLSWPIGWVVSIVISLVFYLRGGWKRAAIIRVTADNEAYDGNLGQATEKPSGEEYIA